MIRRAELTNQIPANSTALKSAKILLPEGVSKNFTFAWVCDAKGGLYLSVNKDHMITCGTGTIDLATTLKIKGAKPITCPDTKKACPGNTAVTIFTKFANTAEEFQAKQATFIAGLAKAASVSPLQVVVTNVKLLYTPKPPPPAVEEEVTGVVPVEEPAVAAAAEPVAEGPAAAAAAKEAPAAKPSNATKLAEAKPAPPKESAPLRKLLRALFATEAPSAAAAAPTKEAAPKPAAAEEVAAAEEAQPAKEETPAAPKEQEESPASLDAAATVEELPGGPKPLIEVTTSIQPLTDDEAESVLGTTGSPYFIKTFKETLTATNLTITEDLVTKIQEPAKEFVWPEPEVPAAANKTAKLPIDAQLIPIPVELPAANVTANETAPAAQSSAGGSSFSLLATVAVAVLGAVMAL